MIARAVVLASFALAARLPAQAVRLRTVYGTGGAVSVGSVGDTVWLSIRTWNGDMFTLRSDSETMAAWTDSPTLINDQAITFTPGSPDTSAGYFVHAAPGTRRDSILLSADSARAVFAAMRGATPVYTTAEPAYLRFQVQHEAEPIRGTPVPDYPEGERARQVAGTVVTRFVVDSTGRIDSRSVVIVASTSSAFTAAVRRGLRDMRFHPAQLNARNVAEVVDMPFAFRLAVAPPVPSDVLGVMVLAR